MNIRRLWHRPNFELDQTARDSLEGWCLRRVRHSTYRAQATALIDWCCRASASLLGGWEQLEKEATLEDVAGTHGTLWSLVAPARCRDATKVVDGASILLEKSRGETRGTQFECFMQRRFLRCCDSVFLASSTHLDLQWAKSQVAIFPATTIGVQEEELQGRLSH